MSKFRVIVFTSIFILSGFSGLSCAGGKKVVKKKKVVKVEQLDPNYQPEHKTIFDAIQHKDLKAVKYYLEVKGVSANALNSDQQKKSILMEASKQGSLEIIKYLIKSGANLKHLDAQEKSVLQYAVLSNNIDIVGGFIKRGLAINHQDLKGNTALIYAGKRNSLGMIKFLLKNKARLDLVNKKGESVLAFAVENGNLEAVKYLNRQGLSLRGLNNQKETLYFYAQTPEMGSYLIQKGVNINQENIKNRLALFQYIKKENLKMVDFFYRKGGNINKEDYNGDHAAIYATKLKNPKVIDYLYRHGINMNKMNNKGETVIHYAWNLGAIKYFYRHQVDITKQNLFGKDKLMLLAENKQLTVKTFKYFIQHHYDVNASDHEDRYIIHYVIEHGDLGMLKYLVKQHASLDVMFKGKNLLSYAKGYGKNTMYNYLKKYISDSLY